MTIYLDVVFLENLCMNYAILLATGLIAKAKIKQLRLIISASLGALYSIALYMDFLSIYSNVIMKIGLSILMTYLSFSPKKIKLLGKQLVLFYLTSLLFGGTAFFLLYFVKPQEVLFKNGVLIGSYPIKIAFLGGVVGFLVINIAFKAVKGKLTKKDMFCNVKIVINQNSVNVKAIIDTGNLLKDPITGQGVIVVEKEQLYGVLPDLLLDKLEKIIKGEGENILNELTKNEPFLKFRIIPFTSLGKQNGLLLGVKPDYVLIENAAEENKTENVVIGIYEKNLTKNNAYSALVGLDILERREKKSEFVANIKV